MNYTLQNRRAITSYGIILYTITKDGQYLYLLGQRRDSISYMEFLKNNLTINNIEMHINLMSNEERKRCIEYKHNFSLLWQDLCINHKNRIYRQDYFKRKHSFYYNMYMYYKHFLNPKNNRKYNPWSFFKGRKEIDETPLQCALREFSEETGIHNKLTVLNVPEYSEMYTGTDDKLYQSIYYLAYIPYQPKIELQITPYNLRKFRISDEMSSISWMSYEMALKVLNDNSVGCKQRVNILKNVNHMLDNKQRKRSKSI